MLEPVARGLFGLPGGVCRDEPVLGLALKLRVTKKDRQHHGGAGEHVIGGDVGCLAVAGKVAKASQRAGDGLAETCLMRAARRGWHRVTIGMEEPVLAGAEPGDRPFEFLAVEFDKVGKGGGDEKRRIGGGVVQIVRQAAGVMQHRLSWHRIVIRQQRRIAAPTDFHPGEQIGLGARHPVKGGGAEIRLLAKNLGIGAEGHRRAALVRGSADCGQRTLRDAAREALLIEGFFARNLDMQFG